MDVQKSDLKQTLIDYVEAARSPGIKLDYETAEAVETESKSTIVTVRVAEATSPHEAVDLRQLLKKLQASTTLGAVDLYPAPPARLAIHGAVDNRNYKIDVQL